MFLVNSNVKFFLVTKTLRNPVEYCMNVSATHTPSDYVGIKEDNLSNDEKNVQNQENNKNSGEGNSKELQIAVENDGLDIDLNFLNILM